MNTSLVHVLEVVVYSILNLIPYMILALTMFRKRLRFGTKGTHLLMLGLSLFQIIVGFSAAILFPDHASSVSLIQYAVYIVFFAVAVKASAGQLAFLLFLIANYASLNVLIAKCLEYQLFGPIALEGYRWTFSLTLIMSESVSLPLLACFVSRKIRPALEIQGSERLWRYLWLIPFTFYTIYFYATYYANRGTESIEIAIRPESSIFMLAINLGSLLIYAAVTRLIESNDQRVRLQRENYQLQMRSMQYAHLEERMEETRRARHDLRQHINILLSYCDQNRFDEVKKYLDQFRQNAKPDGALYYCRNTAVNTVAVYYVDQARRCGAKADVHIDLPEKMNISDPELTVLFGNLLENAVEALRRNDMPERFLRLNVSGEKLLAIVLDNSYQGEIRESDGLFRSTKRESFGVGIQSVRAIAEKYGGVASFEYGNGVFHASVMLNLPSACHDADAG